MTNGKNIFGTGPDGSEVALWTISAQGKGPIDEISLTDFGASLTSVRWGGREICLGYDSYEDYFNQTAVMGAVPGPFANRIANARFELNSETYKLEANLPPHTLHSGTANLAFRNWKSVEINAADGSWSGVEFSITSPHGSGGFPGNLACKVRYMLKPGLQGDSYLIMHFLAETDAPTPVNLTNHAYWNLGGEDLGHLRGHAVKINADSYVDVDFDGIPTGVIAEAGCGTGLMDLRQYVDLTSRIYPRQMAEALDLEPLMPEGYNHSYCVQPESEQLSLESSDAFLADILSAGKPRLAASVRYDGDNQKSRCMDVYTSYPGVHFYTSNYLNEEHGRAGHRFGKQSAFCLETQYYPDSPNQPHFPDCILQPGQLYSEVTCHRFYEV